ncbi:MASE4 domain-containing protein [Cognatilysobacter terrigena]|uniref:MASE4 domain-containing protein n=1 Tax=Cognatilysobacter terrigena TaxID=2488749 RepID=UPI001060E93A|nr:MASE4 domain-containing protein [Lysobacter terrigena]
MPFTMLSSLPDESAGFPLLGNLQASPRDIRLARALVALLVVAFLATAPFASRPWPAIPAFVPVYDTAVAALCLFTVVLLHGQYRGLRSPAYLWLGCGYGFAGITAMAHGLSLPNAFVPGQLFGDAQTTVWLWMTWHTVFPLFVLGFIFSVRRETPADRGRGKYAYGATLVFALVVVIAASNASKWLPPLIDGTHYRRITLQMLAGAWLVHLVAIACMARRVQRRRLIDLWIAVALTADAIDLGLSGLLVTGRYQLGFYVGRMYGLITAVAVLTLLLLYAAELQRRYLRTRSDIDLHERRYTDLFESMSEAFHVVEARRDDDRVVDLTFVEENPAAQRLVGMSAIGRHIGEVHPGRETQWLDMATRVLESGTPEEFEWPATNGRIFAYRVFRAGRHADQIGVLFNDVTDARTAEAALADSETRQRILVQGVPQLLWRTDAQGQSTWASPQWFAYTGQSPSTVLGTGWMDVVHADDRELTHRQWVAAHRTGRLDVEHRLRARDGSYRWHRSRSEPHYASDGRIESWLGSSTDIHDLRSLQDRQSVLVAELQHRTRNLLSVVRALADRTARDSEDLEDFRPTFRDRIDALARAQSLLSRLDDTDRVTFEELLESQVAGISGVRAAQDDGRIVLDGPPGVRLRSSTVQTLALALHELTVNALKYGALSDPNGRLEIRWTVQRDAQGVPRLHVIWKESGMRIDLDTPVQGGGYGRELIERALPYQLGASTSYAIEPDGVRCAIVMPVSAKTSLENRIASDRSAAAS